MQHFSSQAAPANVCSFHGCGLAASLTSTGLHTHPCVEVLTTGPPHDLRSDLSQEALILFDDHLGYLSPKVFLYSILVLSYPASCFVLVRCTIPIHVFVPLPFYQAEKKLLIPFTNQRLSHPDGQAFIRVYSGLHMVFTPSMVQQLAELFQFNSPTSAPIPPS